MESSLWPAAIRAIAASLVAWIRREQEAVVAYQAEEIRALRELLGGKRLRFTDAQRRRLALKSRPLSHAKLREIGSIVTPDTLTRWFRKYAGAKYDSHAKRRPGRPPKPQEIRELVVRLAQENTSWGYTRIRDVMRHLGHEIGRTTVARILDQDGIQPAPERRKHMPWATFLKAYWGAIAAMDFFKVEVLSLRGPIRYAVLVVMDLQSRRVQIAGIIREPFENLMLQVLRNLTDGVDGFLMSHVYLIMDRDPVFTQEFRARLSRAGIEPIRLPRRSPNLDAHVERFHRSIREACLDRVIPLGEAHLRRLVREYMSHYHEERPHQGLSGDFVTGSRPCGPPHGVNDSADFSITTTAKRRVTGRFSFGTLRVRVSRLRQSRAPCLRAACRPDADGRHSVMAVRHSWKVGKTLRDRGRYHCRSPENVP